MHELALSKVYLLFIDCIDFSIHPWQIRFQTSKSPLPYRLGVPELQMLRTSNRSLDDRFEEEFKPFLNKINKIVSFLYVDHSQSMLFLD